MAEDRTAPAAETEENLSDILRIRREKLAELRANGKDPFVIRRFDKTHDFKTIRDAFDALEGSDVIVAGRILSRRDMGKANFIDLVDRKRQDAGLHQIRRHRAPTRLRNTASGTSATSSA